jgi:hypothetical protein
MLRCATMLRASRILARNTVRAANVRLEMPPAWKKTARIAFSRNLCDQPDQWTAVQDKTGGIYYWNPKTNETTAVGAPKPGTSSWIPVQDKETGGIYYWNPSTNETTVVGAPDPAAQSHHITPHLPRKSPGRIWDLQNRVLVLRRDARGSEMHPLVYSMLFGAEAAMDDPASYNLGYIIQVDEAGDRALVAWRQLLCPSLGGSAKLGPTVWEEDRSEGWLKLSGFADENDPEISPFPCEAVAAQECTVTLKLVADRRVPTMNCVRLTAFPSSILACEETYAIAHTFYCPLSLTMDID